MLVKSLIMQYADIAVPEQKGQIVVNNRKGALQTCEDEAYTQRA